MLFGKYSGLMEIMGQIHMNLKGRERGGSAREKRRNKVRERRREKPGILGAFDRHGCVCSYRVLPSVVCGWQQGRHPHLGAC